MKAHSTHTCISYKKCLELYLSFLDAVRDKKIWNVTRDDFNSKDIICFLNWLETDRKNSLSTVNQRLSLIKTFCGHLCEQKIIHPDILSEIQLINKRKIFKKEPTEDLTVEQVKYILSLPDTTTKKGLRDLCFMSLLYDSGCRDSELLFLKLKDIKFNDKVADIKVIGKGNKIRIIPLTEQVVNILKKYISIYHMSKKDENDYLFYTVIKNNINHMSDDNAARILNKYEEIARFQKYDIPHLHPHLFRHARAIHLYRSGMPLPLICEWLGHSQLETTFIYAFADIEMKRNAIENASNDINTMFDTNEFEYDDDEDTIKRLYGLL